MTIATKPSITAMLGAALYVVSTFALTVLPAVADVVSPHYEDRDSTYSKEAPNSAFYGTGVTGRMNEASMLRYEAEQSLVERKFDEAVRKSGKAMQLDPGDPSTHILYARSITGKLYASKGPLNEQLLRECIAEWKLIWRHSTDITEQIEARRNAKVLVKVGKELDRTKEQRTELLATKARMVEKAKDSGSKESTDKAKDNGSKEADNTEKPRAEAAVPNSTN